MSASVKIGQRVKVSTPTKLFHGSTGVILKKYKHPYLRNVFWVRLDNQGTHGFEVDNLEPLKVKYDRSDCKTKKRKRTA
jgi:hypothetical protein